MIIVRTRIFTKAAVKYIRAGNRKILRSLEQVIGLLSILDSQSVTELRVRWRDHVLTSDKRGMRELHLGFDDLLLYRIHEKEQVIELLDIVNHEQLRKRRV